MILVKGQEFDDVWVLICTFCILVHEFVTFVSAIVLTPVIFSEPQNVGSTHYLALKQCLHTVAICIE